MDSWVSPKRADTSFRDGDIELDQVFDCAAATIASVELLHRIRKGQFYLGRLRNVGQAAARKLERSARGPTSARVLTKSFGRAE